MSLDRLSTGLLLTALAQPACKPEYKPDPSVDDCIRGVENALGEQCVSLAKTCLDEEPCPARDPESEGSCYGAEMECLDDMALTCTYRDAVEHCLAWSSDTGLYLDTASPCVDVESFFECPED